MSEQKSKETVAAVTEAQVAEYLQKNPEFFTQHPSLLETLVIPHRTGSAVSLIERQTSVLREKNRRMHQTLEELIDTARFNELQFEKTKRIVLALLEAGSPDEVMIALEDGLCRDFHSDTMSLILLKEQAPGEHNLRVVTSEEAELIGLLLESSLSVCGQLPAEQNKFIFPTLSDRVRSAAVVPLVKGHTLGVLAMGSFDPNYFQSSQGTVLLSYVGEVLSRVLWQTLHKPE